MVKQDVYHDVTLTQLLAWMGDLSSEVPRLYITEMSHMNEFTSSLPLPQ